MPIYCWVSTFEKSHTNCVLNPRPPAPVASSLTTQPQHFWGISVIQISGQHFWGISVIQISGQHFWAISVIQRSGQHFWGISVIQISGQHLATVSSYRERFPFSSTNRQLLNFSISAFACLHIPLPAYALNTQLKSKLIIEPYPERERELANILLWLEPKTERLLLRSKLNRKHSLYLQLFQFYVSF